MFGTATFKPGHFLATYQHHTIFEVFHIEEGKAEYVVNGEKSILGPANALPSRPGNHIPKVNLSRK
tara:strand:- start:725 stop:922 length:198 start_codon:yes stop_codon:yes gene_type:complete